MFSHAYIPLKRPRAHPRADTLEELTEKNRMNHHDCLLNRWNRSNASGGEAQLESEERQKHLSQSVWLLMNSSPGVRCLHDGPHEMGKW